MQPTFNSQVTRHERVESLADYLAFRGVLAAWTFVFTAFAIPFGRVMLSCCVVCIKNSFMA
jgi:hypothetical protein